VTGAPVSQARDKLAARCSCTYEADPMTLSARDPGATPAGAAGSVGRPGVLPGAKRDGRPIAGAAESASE
jgi:hypothetical protein